MAQQAQTETVDLSRFFAIFPVHSALPGGKCSCGKVPCTSVGKHPLTRNGLKDSSRDRGQIARWSAQFPRANWAVDAEASQLVVIDIDPKNGGDEEWLRLTCAHTALPQTITVSTGGGGKHYYFKAPYNTSVASSAGKLGKGLDVRAKGGYVVAPPSNHASGGKYEWIISPVDCEPAPLPDWLLDMLEKTKRGPKPKAPSTATQAPVITGDGWLVEAMRIDGLLGRDLGDRFETVCPWTFEHTVPQEQPDSSSVVYRAAPGHTLGWFHCSHAHCAHRTIDDVRAVLSATAQDWANKQYPMQRQLLPDPHLGDIAECPPDDDDKPLPPDPDERKPAPVINIKTREWLPSPDAEPAPLQPITDPDADTLAHSSPDLSSEGKLLATVHNALVLFAELEEWRGVLAFDEMQDKVVYLKQPPLPKWQHMHKVDRYCPLRDIDYTRIEQWFASVHSIRLGSENSRKAIDLQASANRIHPIRTYLERCLAEWDHEPRLATGAVVYLHAKDEHQLSNEFFRRWMISAVARVFEPGCQVDHTLVLEGRQGCGKSEFLQSISKVDGRSYYKSLAMDLSNKDAVAGLHQGAWIIVMSELASMLRTSTQSVKDFLTSREDRYRKSYGHVEEVHPRSCVFAADTNETEWLRDNTGGRRLWPVRCGTIDTDLATQDREQLWGEAVSQYRSGEAWHLDSVDLTAKATEIQLQRLETDPWAEKIDLWLRKQGANPFKLLEVFEGPLDLSAHDITPGNSQRLFRLLRRAGFHSKVLWVGGKNERLWGLREAKGD